MKPSHETEPRTLTELGLPPELASRFESCFQAMGATRGDRVVGFTFRTLDGAAHALRIEGSPAAAARRAA